MQIPFGEYELKMTYRDGRRYVFDIVRKKYVFLSPEEWVRQNVLHYLIEDCGYARGRIRVEMGLTLNGLSKRCDIAVFDAEGAPAMIVECKRPEIPIDQSTFDQIGRYNMVMKVPILVVSNGRQHYCCRIDSDAQAFEFLREIPRPEEVDRAAPEKS